MASQTMGHWGTGALGHVPLDFQEKNYQVTSEPQKVYNSRLHCEPKKHTKTR